jgi:hypothetical protein
MYPIFNMLQLMGFIANSTLLAMKGIFAPIFDLSCILDHIDIL